MSDSEHEAVRKRKCPGCDTQLWRVVYRGGHLNPDQFDSVRAGDWYCDNEAWHGRKYTYFWKFAFAALDASRAECERLKVLERAIDNRLPSRLCSDDLTQMQTTIEQLRTDLAEWKEKHTIVAGSLHEATLENERLQAQLDGTDGCTKWVCRECRFAKPQGAPFGAVCENCGTANWQRYQ